MMILQKSTADAAGWQMPEGLLTAVNSAKHPCISSKSAICGFKVKKGRVVRFFDVLNDLFRALSHNNQYGVFIGYHVGLYSILKKDPRPHYEAVCDVVCKAIEPASGHYNHHDVHPSGDFRKPRISAGQAHRFSSLFVPQDAHGILWHSACANSPDVCRLSD